MEEPRDVETFEAGHGIRELDRLRRRFGGRKWRKCKGIASIRLETGEVCLAELHWYECHGIGRRLVKLKRVVE